jgi:RNA polymerase sigma-70 factor (ECF subfamily)
VDAQYGGQPNPGIGHAFDTGAQSAVGVLGPPDIRAEFGAHLEANYPRLIAQLCMITLDLDQAHELVDDAYARAWQRWSTVRELPDPTGWVRQLAVRASGSRWRRIRKRLKRSGVVGKIDDPEQLAVLESLGKLTLYLRRPLVLADVAHLTFEEVARVENIVPVLAESRVLRARDELERALSDRPPVEPGPGAGWEQM